MRIMNAGKEWGNAMVRGLSRKENLKERKEIDGLNHQVGKKLKKYPGK